MSPSSGCGMLLSPASRVLQRLVGLRQSPSRPRQRRPDGGSFDLQHSGDLSVVQPFLLQEQRLPVTLGECVERVPRVRRLVSALDRGLHGLPLCLACLRRHQLEVPALPRGAPCLVTHQVVGHREQPRALVHDLLLSKRTHEGLLCDFLRPIAVAKASREIPHQRRVVLAEETFGLLHACHQSRTSASSAAASSCDAPSSAISMATRRPCVRTRSPTANSGPSSGSRRTTSKYAGENARIRTPRAPASGRVSVQTLSRRRNVCVPAIRDDSSLRRRSSRSARVRAEGCSAAAFAASKRSIAGAAAPAAPAAPAESRIPGSVTRYDVSSVGMP